MVAPGTWAQDFEHADPLDRLRRRRVFDRARDCDHRDAVARLSVIHQGENLRRVGRAGEAGPGSEVPDQQQHRERQRHSAKSAGVNGSVGHARRYAASRAQGQLSSPHNTLDQGLEVRPDGDTRGCARAGNSQRPAPLAPIIGNQPHQREQGGAAQHARRPSHQKIHLRPALPGNSGPLR